MDSALHYEASPIDIRNELERHLSPVHQIASEAESLKLYLCPIEGCEHNSCEMAFPLEDDLKSHMERHSDWLPVNQGTGSPEHEQ